MFTWRPSLAADLSLFTRSTSERIITQLHAQPLTRRPREPRNMDTNEDNWVSFIIACHSLYFGGRKLSPLPKKRVPL